ncbi:MAG: acyltransferase [Xanthomonadales bacterium PRO7]|nr:acyltransferase [Xanthomonadales bacterium PRO7]
MNPGVIDSLATSQLAVRATDYVPALTGLRGLAAGWVLVFHLWQFSGSPALVIHIADFAIHLTPLAASGFLGVDLFFGLSGFLLSMPFHRAALARAPMPNLRTFGIRRCRRVLPAYYANLAIIVAVLFALGQVSSLTSLNLVSHLLLVQNLVPVRETFNGVYWTMPIEWDFYAVLPVLMFTLVRSRAGLVLLGVLALVLAFRLLCYGAYFNEPWANHFDYGWIVQLPARLDEFFFGVLGAGIFVRRPPSARAGNALLITGAVGIALAMAVFARVGNDLLPPQMPWMLLHFTWIGAAFGAFILGAAGQRSWFCWRWLAWLGLISYSLYLWHYPLLEAAQHFHLLGTGDTTALLFTTLIATPAILLVSWLSQHCVERPFLAPHQRKVADLQQLGAPE